jgi:hypothetical protein
VGLLFFHCLPQRTHDGLLVYLMPALSAAYSREADDGEAEQSAGFGVYCFT